MKTITDYFEDEIEYPREIFENPIPMNILWSYVSSTFVNGFVNYGKPVGCWVANRYNSQNCIVTARVCNKRKSDWHDFKTTKIGLIDTLNSGDKTMFHTKLGSFSDDVFLLLKSENLERVYMYVWFDCDVSDCCIGKFKTEDTEEEVRQSVINWLDQEAKDKKGIFEEFMEYGVQSYNELQVSAITGWISF